MLDSDHAVLRIRALDLKSKWHSGLTCFRVMRPVVKAVARVFDQTQTKHLILWGWSMQVHPPQPLIRMYLRMAFMVAVETASPIETHTRAACHKVRVLIYIDTRDRWIKQKMQH